MDLSLPEINQELSNTDPWDIVAWAHTTFKSGLVLSSSFGAESALMLHLVTKIIPQVPVIFIDTGYHFPETLVFMEALRHRFNLNLHIYQGVQSSKEMEAEHGKLWESDVNHYNHLRKVEPMERALKELGVTTWLSGLRADQTKFRTNLQTVGKRIDGIYAIYPILHWKRRDIDNYFTIYELPFHPLVAQGYSSIGDSHSTKPSSDRTGRFKGKTEECGVHTFGRGEGI